MARPFEQASIQAGDLSGMAVMNMAVNGFNKVSLENGDAVVTLPASAGSARYLTDQWSLFQSGSIATQGQRIANPFPTMPGIKAGLKVTVNTAAAMGAGDSLTLFQPIEGNRVGMLGWGTALGIPMTVGVMMRWSLPATFYIGLHNGAAGNRKRFTRVSCAANVDTFVPLRFDPDVAGSWVSDNSCGMNLFIKLAQGSNGIGTPDQWISGSVFEAGADQFNFASAAGNSVIVSGLVMFPGIVPLSKEVLPLIARHQPDEDRLCRRYYEKVNLRWYIDLNAGASVGVVGTAYYKEIKRIVPSILMPATNSGGTTVIDRSDVDAVAITVSYNPATRYSSIDLFGQLISANARMT